MLRLAFAALAALAVGLATFWFLSIPPPAPEAPNENSAAVQSEPATSASISTETKVEPKNAGLAPVSNGNSRPAPQTLDSAIREASEALPLAADLRKLPAGELHGTPEPVRKAAWAIGAVAEAVERDPARAGEALAFYGECARRPGVAASTQALCLSSMRELSKSSGIPAVEDGVSPEAKRIADFTMSK